VKPKAIALGITLGAAALVPGATHANPQFTCCGGANPVRWNTAGSNVVMRSDLATGNIWRTRMANAASGWGNFSGSALNINLDINQDTNGVSFANGENEMYFTSAANPNNWLAAESTDYQNIPNCASEPCCFSNPCSAPGIIESDIRFFLNDSSGTAFAWDSGFPENIIQSNSFPRYFGVVASHELGHTVGLADLSSHGMARMTFAYPNGGWYHEGATDVDKLDVLAQEREDIRFMYPAAGSVAGVYAVNMQLDPSTGRSQVLSFDPATSNINRFPRRNPPLAGDATGKLARVGDTVDFRICYGNAGNLARTNVPIDLYLSTGETLAGATQTSNSWSLATLSAHADACATISLTVPAVPTNVAYNILYRMDSSGGDNIGIVNQRVVVVP